MSIPITFLDKSLLYVKVRGCVYSATTPRSILRELQWLPKELLDDVTCDVPKPVGDLLTSDENILCMYSRL